MFASEAIEKPELLRFLLIHCYLGLLPWQPMAIVLNFFK